MSISTKTGDDGTTSLLFGKRVSKASPRVRFYGALDELSACITAGRSHITNAADRDKLRAVQERLVQATAEAATPPENLEAFLSSFKPIGDEDLVFLEAEIHRMEADGVKFNGWVEDLQPGYAQLDLARTICRRAESIAFELAQTETIRIELLTYLNRLSDFLWIFARAGRSES